METIEMLINELESNILKAKKAMLSSTDVVVNKAEMLDLISHIRENYPVALKDAARILKERDDIIAQAADYANATMDKAEEDARRLIAQSEIVRRAQASAQDIHDEATGHFRKMDYESRAMAFELLTDVEETMRNALAQINERKQKLIND